MDAKGRILVVDDDAEMRGLIQRYLTQNGLKVRVAADGRALDAALRREPVDVVVLDLMMPGEDGLAICRRLRFGGDETPIIMLTAKGDPVDRIVGLEMGADDYLGKPFNPRELLARIQVILRRRSPVRRDGDAIIRFGPFALNLAAMTLTNGPAPVALSSREYSILKALALNAGRPLSREKLIDLSMGRDAEVNDRSIDVAVNRLRKALGESPSDPAHIKTVWGVGYVLAVAGGAG